MFRLVVLLHLVAHCLSFGPGLPIVKHHLDKADDNGSGGKALPEIPETNLDDCNPKYHVEKIVETGTGGEAPHWVIGQQTLFFLEPMGQTLHKYVPATKKHTKTRLGALIGLGFITPVEGTTDKFIVAKDLKFLIVQWDGEEGSEVKILKTLAELHSGSRLGDGKADPRGRVFAGTLSLDMLPTSALFRVDGSKISELEDGIIVGNGLVWDENENAFYYIDSNEFLKIRRYDYDMKTGSISNKTYVFDGIKYGLIGILDGMTMDTDGNLLVANNGGRAILHINPKTGELLQRIYLPVPVFFITSVAFGGPNLDILYVTTMKLPTSTKIGQSLNVDNSGATFAITGLGIQGFPMAHFKYDTDTTD